MIYPHIWLEVHQDMPGYWVWQEDEYFCRPMKFIPFSQVVWC